MVCRAVLFVRVAIVRPRGIWEQEHVILWRLHHHLNTLLLTFCEVVSVLEFSVFVLFDANLLLLRGFSCFQAVYGPSEGYK